MHLSPMDYFLSGASLCCAIVQTWTLRILIKRNLSAEFRQFFRYTAYCVFIAVLGLIASIWTSCSQYYYLFWACNVLMFCLEFGVMYEIFVNAMKPYSALIDLGKMLFRWAALFLILAALLTAVATSGSGNNRIVAAITITQRSLRLMQIGLLLLFFLFEKRLGLSWRSYNMMIALGLGVAASVDLIQSYLSSRFTNWYSALSAIGLVVYLVIVTFWALRLRQPEPARRNVLDSPSKLIFQRWNEALVAAPVPAPAKGTAAASIDAFLPGIEKTVDRVLARKIAN
jgi:hypothetical protein